MTISEMIQFLLPIITVFTILYLFNLARITRGGALGQMALITAISLIFFFSQGLVGDLLDPAVYPVDNIGDTLQIIGSLIFLFGFYRLHDSIKPNRV